MLDKLCEVNPFPVNVHGTTHVFFSPLDFIGRLAALVPPPRFNLTRCYSVSAPNAKVRAELTASQRGKNSPRLAEHLKYLDKLYQGRSMSWSAGDRHND
jgi:hypothetical protein